LPLLTSKPWWEETSWQLRQLFALDPDFHPGMFNVCPHSDREVSLWLLTVGRSETTSCHQGTGVGHRPVVETRGKLLLAYAALETELTILQDKGPLELTRRQKVPGRDDDPFEDHEDRPSLPHASINAMPLPAPTLRLSFARPRRQRLDSSPPRRSAGFLNFTRPVSFSTTYSEVHPGMTGVDGEVGRGRGELEETRWPGNPDREEDVAESATSPRTRNGRPPGPISASGRISHSSSSHTHTHSDDDSVSPAMTASFSGPFSPGGVSDGLPAVVEEAPSSNASEVGDEDLAQMSKSMSYMDAPPSLHSRWMSQDGNRPRLDWIIDEEETSKSKTVIVEVRTFPPLSS